MSLLLHQIWRNVALHPCLREWMLCSEWVPSEWESKQLIKTLQEIHTTPFYQLPYEVKSCVCKKKLIRVRRFHLNCCFWLKYEQKHFFLQWKQVLSCLIWEKIMHIFAPFTSKNSSKQIWVDFWFFFTEESAWRDNGEHPLVSKWCDAKLSKSVLMKIQTHLHLQWPESQELFSKWTFPLICCKNFQKALN